MQSILCTNSTCARCAESPHQIKLVRSFPNNFRSSPMIKLRGIFGFDFTLNRLDDDVDGNDDVDRRKELWVWMACGKVLDPGGFDHPPPISPFPNAFYQTLVVMMITIIMAMVVTTMKALDLLWVAFAILPFTQCIFHRLTM